MTKVLDFLPSALESARTIHDLQKRWHVLYPLHRMLALQPHYALQVYEAMRATVIGFDEEKRYALISLLSYMFAPYGIEVSEEEILEEIEETLAALDAENNLSAKIIPFHPKDKSPDD